MCEDQDPNLNDKSVIEDMLQRGIIDLNGEEFVQLMAYAFASTVFPRNDSDLPPIVYGMDGLMRLLNVSISTAWRIKKSGVIDDAITQIERTIIIDSRKALSLLHDSAINKKRLS